jgi:hypothetical protein
VFVKKQFKLFVHKRFDYALHLGVAKFAFCLSLELRVGHFHRKNGGQPFAHIVTGKGLFQLFGMF